MAPLGIASFEMTDSDRPPAKIDTIHTWSIYFLIVSTTVFYSFSFTTFAAAKDILVYVTALVMAAVSVFRAADIENAIRAFFPVICFFCLHAVFHLVPQENVPANESFITILRQLAFFSVLIASFDLLARPSVRTGVQNAVVVSAALAAVLAVLQYTGSAPFLFPTFGNTAQRVYSTFGNQDLLGGYMAVGLALSHYAAIQSSKPQLLRLLVNALMLIALLLAGSRTGWLAAAVGFTWASTAQGRQSIRRSAVYAFPLVAVVVSLIVLSPETTVGRMRITFSDDDIGGNVRYWLWAGTAAMFWSAPLTGVGLGMYSHWSPYYLGEVLRAPGGENLMYNQLHALHAHSEPLHILAEGGVAGFALMVWMWYRVARRSGPEWFGLAALFVFSLFNPTFVSTPFALAALFLSGSLMALPVVDPRQNEPKPKTRAGIAIGRVGWSVLMTALALLALWTVTIPDYWFQRGQEKHLAGEMPLSDYERVLRSPIPPVRAYEYYTVAVYDYYPPDVSYGVFEAALRYVDTGQIYLGLAELAHALDNGHAVEWARECVWRWPGSQRAWAIVVLNTPPSEAEALEREISQWLPDTGPLFGRPPAIE